jgi:ubiquinone/menaquinone biosynthesis C-methylase UbiE
VSAQPDYDRHARLYDRLIGNRLYNRLIWGVDVRHYAAFAAEAVASGDGPMLDAGCGTAVFTAGAYRTATRPLTLVDRSAGMLDRARQRLGDATAELVQGDLFALPFPPGGFETVGCFAMLHVLADPWAGLIALRPQLAPGGRLFVSMLVADGGGVSRAYLRALHRRGEVGPPRTSDELHAAAVPLFGEDLSVQRIGAMAFLRAQLAA